MVSLTSTVVRTDEQIQKLYPSFTGRPLHRRATASGTIRRRDEFEEDDMDEQPLPTSVAKKARTVAFNPVPDVGFANTPPKPLEVVREEVIQAVIGKPLGDLTAYDKIMTVFRSGSSEHEGGMDAEVGSTTLNNYLIALTSHVSDLKPSFASLVDAIVNFNWIGYDDIFVNLYIRFLSHLASAQSQYVAKILRRFAGQLVGFSGAASQVPLYPPVSRYQAYKRVHFAINEILRVVPSASVQLMSILSSTFPHSTESTRLHTDYVQNLLEVLKYAPELRSEVLELITDRLVKIDVQVQMDLEDLEVITGEELVDQLENDIEQDEDSEDEDDEDSAQRRVKELKTNVTTTDAILSLLFAYYESSVTSPESSETTFSLLLHQFNNIILPTFRSRHTQFLLFRFAQSSPALTDFFLGACVTAAIDESLSLVLRESAAAYAASFVARAKAIESQTVQETIHFLCSWLRDYIARYPPAKVVPDTRRHGAFYAIFQATLYIFCFRWRNLLDGDHDEETEDIDITQDLEWTPILKETLTLAIHSRFQPLTVCSPVVVSQFEKVSRKLRFMYIATVLKEHARQTWGRDVQELEAYFPFDPYKLPRSKGYVEELYVEWRGVGDEDEDDDDDDDESEAE